MSETTKHTVLHEVDTGNFKGELSRTDRGAQLVSIMRSFFYQGKVITQKINFLLQHLDELEYVVENLKSKRDKLLNPSAPSASPGQAGNGAAIPAQGD